MYYLRNFIYLINGVLKCMFIKLFHPKKFCFRGGSRMALSSRITILNNGKMTLGKNLRIIEYSSISVLKEGTLILGNNVSLGGNNRIVCHDLITIGDGTIMGPNVCIYDHDHLFSETKGVERKAYKTAPIVIGKNCWIGANVIILRGTTIGDHCLIGAGSVVKGNIPDRVTLIQKRQNTVTQMGDSNA